MLKEVLLVDDKSELDHLHEPLERELEKPYYKGRVRLIRNAEREGLIRSRNNGAVAAWGEVVVFLDAHCEVGANWLPPLLAPIHADRWVVFLYRVIHLLRDLGWVDFDFSCSSVCPVLLGLMGIGQKWLCSWARWWNTQIKGNPT